MEIIIIVSCDALLCRTLSLLTLTDCYCAESIIIDYTVVQRSLSLLAVKCAFAEIIIIVGSDLSDFCFLVESIILVVPMFRLLTA